MSNSPKKVYLEALALAKAEADPEKVTQKLLIASSLGSADADYALASWFLHGHKVRRNLKKGIAYLRRSSEGGLAIAFCDLGDCYEEGIGLPKSEKKAFLNYLEAALLGDVQAYHEVGRCFYYGIGVKQDRRVADVWLKKFESESSES